jgi:uncharacterized membrane protein YebE (DUF533 family)
MAPTPPPWLQECSSHEPVSAFQDAQRSSPRKLVAGERQKGSYDAVYFASKLVAEPLLRSTAVFFDRLSHDGL